MRLIATGKIKKSDSVKSIENDKTIKDSKEKLFLIKKNLRQKFMQDTILKIIKNLKGPAVIEESTATTVIPPNYSITKR